MSTINEDSLNAKLGQLEALKDAENRLHELWDKMSAAQKVDALRWLRLIDDRTEEIEDAYLAEVVDSGAHRAVVDELGTIAGKMNEEARKMSDAAKTLTAVATIIGYAADAVAMFGKLA